MLLRSNDFGFLAEGGDHALLDHRRIQMRTSEAGWNSRQIQS